MSTRWAHCLAHRNAEAIVETLLRRASGRNGMDIVSPSHVGRPKQRRSKRRARVRQFDLVRRRMFRDAEVQYFDHQRTVA